MKNPADHKRRRRGLWKNGNRYFHVTTESLTIADFSQRVPTIQFTTPEQFVYPEDGWEKVSIHQFNDLIDARKVLILATPAMGF